MQFREFLTCKLHTNTKKNAKKSLTFVIHVKWQFNLTERWISVKPLARHAGFFRLFIFHRGILSVLWSAHTTIHWKALCPTRIHNRCIRIDGMFTFEWHQRHIQTVNYPNTWLVDFCTDLGCFCFRHYYFQLIRFSYLYIVQLAIILI